MPLEGSAVLDDVRNLEMEIRNLEKGTPIYIRVAAMNMKGYSQFANSNPLYGVPSSEYMQAFTKFEPHRHHYVVSLSKNINPSLVLVQPRKTRPFITERF